MASELVQQAATTTSLMLISVLIFTGLTLAFSYASRQEMVSAEVTKGFCPGQCEFHEGTCKVFASIAGRIAPSEGCRGKVLLHRSIKECVCSVA